jgi:homoserine/homoserine lactone efflux protein
MSLPGYLAFLIACVVVMIIPGPAVTLIVANSLRHGRRAGLLNVAGIQLALALMVGVVLLGLASLIALGWKLLSASGEIEVDTLPRKPRGGFFVQGLAVGLSNPKTLLFFGAFFPQFMDVSRDFTVQVLIMGATAMAVAAMSDSAYALLASRAGAMLSRRRARLMSRASGGMLIGGGLWLALSHSK